VRAQTPAVLKRYYKTAGIAPKTRAERTISSFSLAIYASNASANNNYAKNKDNYPRDLPLRIFPDDRLAVGKA